MRDREAEFRCFAAARSTRLMRTAVLLTGDAQLAEDLLQTTLMKVYLAWGQIRDPADAGAYARRVMTTTYTSWWRRKSFRERPVETIADVPGRDETLGVDDREQLGRLLAGLSRAQRAVLVLRYFEDLSVTETARELGLSEGTVKSHTSRALAQLRVEHDRTSEAIPQ